MVKHPWSNFSYLYPHTRDYLILLPQTSGYVNLLGHSVHGILKYHFNSFEFGYGQHFPRTSDNLFLRRCKSYFRNRLGEWNVELFLAGIHGGSFRSVVYCFRGKSPTV